MDGDEANVDACESSWGRCTAGRLMMASLARGSSKVTRYRETEDRDGLCVSIYMAI